MPADVARDDERNDLSMPQLASGPPPRLNRLNGLAGLVGDLDAMPVRKMPRRRGASQRYSAETNYDLSMWGERLGKDPMRQSIVQGSMRSRDADIIVRNVPWMGQTL